MIKTFKVIIGVIVLLLLILVLALYTNKKQSFDETENIPEFYKNTGCLYISLFKVMDYYSEEISLNDIENAYKKVLRKNSIFIGNYKDLKKVIGELNTKNKYNFYSLPANIDLIEKYIDNKLPLFLNIPQSFPAYYTHSVLIMKKGNNKIIFDPVEYLKDKTSEKHTRIVSKEEIKNLVKYRSFFVLLDETEKISDEVVELNTLVNKLKDYDFKGLDNNDIKNVNFSIDFYEKVFFEMNKNDSKEIMKHFEEYIKKYRDIRLQVDYDYLKFFVENNFLDKKYFLSIADKIYKEKLSIYIYSFPVMKKLYFYTAAGCSISNNKNKLAEYENKHFDRIKSYNEIIKKRIKLPFYEKLKEIGLTAETFKVYKSLDEIPDILNLKK